MAGANIVRISFGWRQIIGAWALVLLLTFVGLGAIRLAPCLAENPSDLPGVRIPQHDPFAVGPPLYGYTDEMELDDGALGGRSR